MKRMRFWPEALILKDFRRVDLLVRNTFDFRTSMALCLPAIGGGDGWQTEVRSALRSSQY
jgi:hypothetical protein